MMKKALIIGLFALIANSSIASHIAGGYINVRHIDSFEYEIQLILYRDVTGTTPPNTVQINMYSRSSITSAGSFTLPLVNAVLGSSHIPHCNPNYPYLEIVTYSSTFQMNHFYNDPSGYYLIWTSCCRNVGVVNLYNPPGTNSRILMTMIPPFADSLGNPIINSTPVLNTPMIDRSCILQLTEKDFGGFDLDGDSIDHVLYVPFTGQASGGIPSPLSSPYPDPLTIFGSIPIASTYSVDDLIHGYPPPNPSPNRLQIDQFTGELSVNPIGPIGYYCYGIWTREYRNGVLIGSVFREMQMIVENCPTILNNPPIAIMAQNQPQAVWNGDTLEFSSNTGCAQLVVSDPDSLSMLLIDVQFMNYDSSEATLLIDSVYSVSGVLINNSICFDPDSFASTPAYCEVVVRNPDCFIELSDTLDFWFRFINYSNAGTGGTYTYPLDQVPMSIDLITKLGGNPNSGGTWTDLDNSGWLNAQGIFQSRYISTPDTFSFMYIDRQPNYPADTALLTLNFILPVSLQEMNVEEILIYPNPTNEIISMVIHDEMQNHQLQVYDLRGNVVHETILVLGKNEIDLRDLPEGLYFYQLGGKGGKFLIQR